jgi:hypothetical protein
MSDICRDVENLTAPGNNTVEEIFTFEKLHSNYRLDEARGEIVSLADSPLRLQIKNHVTRFVSRQSYSHYF